MNRSMGGRASGAIGRRIPYATEKPTRKASDMKMHTKDVRALEDMAAQAVRNHGIDADEINSDSIDDAVHPDVFGEAVNADQFSSYEAAEISDVLHEAIADTYWKMVDEANGNEKE
jgi:hypothetical protein